jgi:hypothetical protein
MLNGYKNFDFATRGSDQLGSWTQPLISNGLGSKVIFCTCFVDEAVYG